MPVQLPKVSTPRFGALYKSVKAEHKGDKLLGAACLLGGVSTLTSASPEPHSSSFILFSLAVALIGKGYNQLFGKKPGPEPKRGVDYQQFKWAAGETFVALGAIESANTLPATATPIFYGLGGAFLAGALESVYKGLKGKPQAALPPK